MQNCLVITTRLEQCRTIIAPQLTPVRLLAAAAARLCWRLRLTNFLTNLVFFTLRLYAINIRKNISERHALPYHNNTGHI